MVDFMVLISIPLLFLKWTWCFADCQVPNASIKEEKYIINKEKMGQYEIICDPDAL